MGNCVCVQHWEQAPGGVQYNPNQLAYIWIQAGGPPQAAAMAAAIAYYHESGGWTTATCINGGTGCSCMGCVDRGLWQIDSANGPGSSYDVMTNARAAVALYQARGWEPWYLDSQKVTSAGQDRGITPEAVPLNGTNAAAGIPSQPTSNAQPNAQLASSGCGVLEWTTSPIQCIGQQTDSWVADALKGVILSILNPFLQLIAGVLGVAAGGTIMILGIMVIVRQSQAGRTATDLGLAALEPEAFASTKYISGDKVTTVEQRRRKALRVGSYQIRPARTRTSVIRPKSVQDQLNDEADSYDDTDEESAA